MFWKKKKPETEEWLPVPAELPPVEGLDEKDQTSERGPRVWLWTLVAALAVVLLVGYVLVLGVMGFYDGLKDRAIENLRTAQEHYALGQEYLEAGNYELAIAEFELALRHDSSLHDARWQLREAKELAKAQSRPTSETRLIAAELLYGQAVAQYKDGNLRQAVAILDELRGLDADYQRENVATMLTTAHYQLGLNAVREDRLEDAQAHFETVLDFNPDDENAQNQINLIQLYTAALSNWDRDWAATIQALKGLYALASDYKDVQSRLHDAHVYYAQDFADKGNWCRAADEYAAAVGVVPAETTVDKRDDAAIQCQATVEAPTPTPTLRVLPTPTRPAGQPTAAPTRTAPPEATPTAVASSGARGQGRIAFTSFDAARQRYDIYIVNLAQGDARLLWENASQPALAPGGKRLAFRNRDPLYLGLGILDLRTNEMRELTTHVEDSAPDWSPDTQQIIFASDRHGDRKWRIYVTSPAEVRGEGEEWAFGQAPTWSPNGSQVAYHGCDERGDNCSVWLMKAGGFSPARLTTHPSDTAPDWSPDGTQIAFTSARAGGWEIYVVDVATGQEKQLTDHPAADDVAPTWSPDGKQLAFLSNRKGAWAIYILDVKSGQVSKVIATGSAHPDPVSQRMAWAP